MKHQLNEIKRLQELAGVVDENEVNSLDDPNIYDDVPSVRITIDDEDGRPKMFLELSAFFHDEGDGKIDLLRDNPMLQELLMQAIQQQAQKMFRHTVHSVLGKPFGIK
jgi:hypothetical protein